MEGSKFKEDLFEESANFIRLEKLYRQSLISYGKGVIELRKAYILSENVLFENLQTILNDFKNKSG